MSPFEYLLKPSVCYALYISRHMEVVLPRRVTVGHRLVQLLRRGHHDARAGAARDCESVVRNGAVGPASLRTTVLLLLLLLLLGRRLAAVLETDGTRAVVRARRARRARRRRAVALVGHLGRRADHLGGRLGSAAESEGRVAQPAAEPREQRVAAVAAAAVVAAVVGALRRWEVGWGCKVGHVQPRHLVAAVPAAVVAIVVAIVVAAAVAAAKLRRRRRRGHERVGRAGGEPTEAEA